MCTSILCKLRTLIIFMHSPIHEILYLMRRALLCCRMWLVRRNARAQMASTGYAPHNSALPEPPVTKQTLNFCSDFVLWFKPVLCVYWAASRAISRCLGTPSIKKTWWHLLCKSNEWYLTYHCLASYCNKFVGNLHMSICILHQHPAPRKLSG